MKNCNECVILNLKPEERKSHCSRCQRESQVESSREKLIDKSPGLGAVC